MLSKRGLHAQEEPDQTLVGILETAQREVAQGQALKRRGAERRGGAASAQPAAR